MEEAAEGVEEAEALAFTSRIASLASALASGGLSAIAINCERRRFFYAPAWWYDNVTTRQIDMSKVFAYERSAERRSVRWLDMFTEGRFSARFMLYNSRPSIALRHERGIRTRQQSDVIEVREGDGRALFLDVNGKVLCEVVRGGAEAPAEEGDGGRRLVMIWRGWAVYARDAEAIDIESSSRNPFDHVDCFVVRGAFEVRVFPSCTVLH